MIHPERKQPERFTYSDAKPVSMWNPTPGFYTRYGDVAQLAAAVDDKMIVMGSGDEIQLRFRSACRRRRKAGHETSCSSWMDGRRIATRIRRTGKARRRCRSTR